MSLPPPPRSPESRTATDRAHRGAVPPDPTRQAAQRLLDGARGKSEFVAAFDVVDVRLVAEAVMEARSAECAESCASSRPFALFHGEFFYPGGGWDDFAGMYATVEEAKAARVPQTYTWAHVVDVRTGDVVCRRKEKRDWEDGAGD